MIGFYSVYPPYSTLHVLFNIDNYILLLGFKHITFWVKVNSFLGSALPPYPINMADGKATVHRGAVFSCF